MYLLQSIDSHDTEIKRSYYLLQVGDPERPVTAIWRSENQRTNGGDSGWKPKTQEWGEQGKTDVPAQIGREWIQVSLTLLLDSGGQSSE